MSDCLFCKIAAGEIPAEVVAADDGFIAFRDLHPLAPVHLLVVPRTHVASLNELRDLGTDSMGMLPFIAAVARQEGIAESGYRVISNTGPDAGQEIMHLHWHVIGGEALGGMV